MVRGLSHPPIVWVTQYEVATLIAGVVNAAVEAKRVPLVSASYHLKVAPGFPLAVTVAVAFAVPQLAIEALTVADVMPATTSTVAFYPDRD